MNGSASNCGSRAWATTYSIGGWSDAEIRKVAGENWLRVYQKVWGQ